MNILKIQKLLKDNLNQNLSSLYFEKTPNNYEITLVVQLQNSSEYYQTIKLTERFAENKNYDVEEEIFNQLKKTFFNLTKEGTYNDHSKSKTSRKN